MGVKVLMKFFYPKKNIMKCEVIKVDLFGSTMYSLKFYEFESFLVEFS